MARISEISLLQQAEQPALVIEAVTDMKGIVQTIGDGFAKIGAYLAENGQEPADMPFVAFPDYVNMTGEKIDMTIGFKTAKALPIKEDIQSVMLPARKIVMAIHRGNFEELGAMYMEMAEWIKSNGYEAEGTSIEYYCTGHETPENEVVTRVEMPLK
jgi:effector-binding domain-containing protein